MKSRCPLPLCPLPLKMSSPSMLCKVHGLLHYLRLIEVHTRNFKGSNLLSSIRFLSIVPFLNYFGFSFSSCLVLPFNCSAWVHGKVAMLSCRPLTTQKKCCSGCLYACPPDALIYVRTMDFQSFLFLLPSHCPWKLNCSSSHKTFAHLHNRKIGTKLKSYWLV